MDTPDARHKADSTGKKQERTGEDDSLGEESEVKQKWVKSLLPCWIGYLIWSLKLQILPISE